MNIYQILCLVLFIACSVTHLVFVFLEKEKGRMITKGLIVGTLLIFAFISKTKEPLIYLGLVSSLFADLILLLTQKKIYFVIGASLFSITHILNFILISRYLPDKLLHWIYFVVVILLGYLLVESFKPLAKPKLKKLAYPCLAYLYIIVALIINTFIVYITSMDIYSLLILFGAIFFLTSDNVLTITKFVKPIRIGHFILMLFYILGQVFIYIPLILKLAQG